MSAVRRLRCPRLLLIALAVAVTAPILAVPGVAAAAPASSGETVVGQLVQAWPEYRDHDEATDRGADGPLSFVRTKAGESVRVDTDDVDDLPLGATVEVTVGRAISDEAATEDGYERARRPRHRGARATTGGAHHHVTCRDARGPPRQRRDGGAGGWDPRLDDAR